MLAGGNGRERHLLVQSVRRGDIYNVDDGIGDHLAPVGSRARKAQRGGGFRSDLIVDVGQGVQFDFVR